MREKETIATQRWNDSQIAYPRAITDAFKAFEKCNTRVAPSNGHPWPFLILQV